MSRARTRRSSGIATSMTSMIDVVFLLIIFFMLVAQLSRQQRVELDLAQLRDDTPARDTRAELAIVNVLPEGGVRLGARTFDDAPTIDAALIRHLVETRDQLPQGTPALVRAARGESYARVHAAMRAAADAGFSSVHLAIDAEPRE
ncbi:MAG: biopolymer transporter ExbD [Planctomycetota bacterium]